MLPDAISAAQYTKLSFSEKLKIKFLQTELNLPEIFS